MQAWWAEETSLKNITVQKLLTGIQVHLKKCEYGDQYMSKYYNIYIWVSINDTV